MPKPLPKRPRKLKSFDRVARALELRTPIAVGVRPIRVEDVVGTVDRVHDFDANFRPSRRLDSQRHRRMLELVKRGVPLPPICVYEVLGEYFVIDGHHRVSAARATGAKYMDARVEVYLPAVDSPAKKLSAERARYELLTGIHDVELSRPGGYPRLLREIREHKWLLSEKAGTDVGLRTAARDWHRHVYSAVVTKMMVRGIGRRPRGRRMGDRYLLFEKDKWLDSEAAGHDLGIEEALGRYSARYADRSGVRRAADAVQAVAFGIQRAGEAITGAVADGLSGPKMHPELTQLFFTAELESPLAWPHHDGADGPGPDGSDPASRSADPSAA